MIVDGLTYLGRSIFGHGATAAELLAALDEAGIGRAVVCPVKPRSYDLWPENERVADAVREHPERLVGFARVDPLLGDEAAEQAAAAFDALGLAGLLLHPWEETFAIGARLVDGVVEVARARGAPVVVAAGYPWLGEALQAAELAGRFPDVAFVLTNGGQLNISGLGQTDVELALAARPNILVQTGGVYREDFLQGVVRRFGADRLVFASGFPLLDPRLELARAQAVSGEPAEAELVLGGSLARLLAR